MSAPRLPILCRAAEAAGVQLGDLVRRTAALPALAPILRGAADPADLGADAVESLLDGFVVAGFVHPRASLLSAAQLATLDGCARQLGLSARDYHRLIRHATGGARRRTMTGAHYLGLLAMFDHHGVADWRPLPGFVDRERAGALRRAAWGAGLPAAEVRALMMRFGGTTRTRELHERGFARVMVALDGLGGVAFLPAPRVEGRPGMVTQAQANVIWRLWHDVRRDDETGEAALDVAIAAELHFPGGLDTLTWAGARKMMDALAAIQGGTFLASCWNRYALRSLKFSIATNIFRRIGIRPYRLCEVSCILEVIIR